MSNFEDAIITAAAVVTIALIGFEIISKIQEADAIELTTPYGQLRTAKYPRLNS